MGSIKQLPRVFMHSGRELSDIDPKLSPEAVMDIYVNQYPELLNAKISNPEIKNDKAVYTFSKSLGTKG